MCLPPCEMRVVQPDDQRLANPTNKRARNGRLAWELRGLLGCEDLLVTNNSSQGAQGTVHCSRVRERLAPVRNGLATSGSNTTTFAPCAYRRAYLPRTPPVKS